MGRLAGLVVLAAVITFCLVQDAETSAGVGRYISAQRAALAGNGPRVTVDEIMGPANRLALRAGMAWSGRVAMAGLIAILIYRRVRSRQDGSPRANRRAALFRRVAKRPDPGEGGPDTTSEGDRRG